MVEDSVKLLPQTNFVSALDFVEESVNSGDCLAFVVSSEDDNLQWVPDFQRKKQANHFAALLTSVDVVAHEQVTAVL